MKELIVTDDYLPVPFPNEDVQKVRDWLERVIPLSACQKFIESITDVIYDCGPGAPQWICTLAKEIARKPPHPIEVQVLCYNAMIQQPIHKACERIFQMSFDTPDVLADAPPRFQKNVGLFFRWKLESAARQSEEFLRNPVAGRTAVSRVWFEIVTDPVLFGKKEVK